MTDSQLSATSYRDRFGSDGEVDRYEKEVYAPSSHSSRMWALQQPLLASLIAEQQRRSGPVSVLDFACGSGRITSFSEHLADVAVGVDISPAMVRVARSRCTRAVILQGDLVEGIELPQNDFDIITAFRFFLNTEPAVRAPVLHALRRRIRRDGLFIANIHGNTRSVRHLTLAARRFRDGADDDMLNELSVREFTALCESAGFQVVSRHGYGVLPRGLYRTPLAGPTEWIDRHLAGGRLAREFASDIVFVCRPAD